MNKETPQEMMRQIRGMEGIYFKKYPELFEYEREEIQKPKSKPREKDKRTQKKMVNRERQQIQDRVGREVLSKGLGVFGNEVFKFRQEQRRQLRSSEDGIQEHGEIYVRREPI